MICKIPGDTYCIQNKCYTYYNTSTRFEEAATQCENSGGKISVISNAVEAEAIKQIMTSEGVDLIWIGIREETDTSFVRLFWRWLDGMLVNF